MGALVEAPMEDPSRRECPPGDMLKVGRLARGPRSSSRDVTDGEAMEKEEGEGMDWEGEERERDLGAGGVMVMEEEGEEEEGLETAGDALEVSGREWGTLGEEVIRLGVVMVMEEEEPMMEREEVRELGCEGDMTE